MQWKITSWLYGLSTYWGDPWSSCVKQVDRQLDTPPFIKNRMKKYGPIFRTSLAGRPVVVSSDPEFNYYVFQQEGKLVERWYMDSFEKFFHQVAPRINAHKNVHKYLRNVILGHFGPEALKDKMLPQLEDAINKRLHGWSKLPSLEVKSNTSAMIFDFTAKQLFSFQADKSKEDICESFTNFLQGLLSFPINIHGTAYHRERVKIRKRDFLDQILADMKTETFLTDKFVIYMMFGLLLASFETISSTLTLAIMLINENPKVIRELTEEHEAILKNKEDVNYGLTWKEYKSMTFTHNVINESLRLASVAPGILRRTLQDIQVNVYHQMNSRTHRKRERERERARRKHRWPPSQALASPEHAAPTTTPTAQVTPPHHLDHAPAKHPRPTNTGPPKSQPTPPSSSIHLFDRQPCTDELRS
ncbi:hypothetical protein SO802_025263 [Lithocarpus litseifolius]|uniref:Cytochrome P450 n=1 Tax=Lithocarpus litseifolius TaxID=425828 RepID=A0AAW2BX92_9ROSI